MLARQRNAAGSCRFKTMVNPLAELTDAQKETLRLYYRRFTAKEIAQRLGISPDTVHQRLAAARRKLGVSDSMAAARALIEAENPTLYDRVVYDEIGVARSPPDASKSVSRLPWPFPTRRRPANDLSFAQKLIAVLGLAAAFMAVAALYLLAIGAMSARL